MSCHRASRIQGVLSASKGFSSLTIKGHAHAPHRIAPEDVDIITPLGLLHLDNNNPSMAFDLFGAALAYDQTDPKVG